MEAPMQRVLILATLLLAAPLGAQDDPLETHLYEIEYLTGGVPDFPGEGVGLAMDSIGTAVSAGEEYRSRLSGGDLTSLIEANIAPGSWEQDGIKIEDLGGVISVTHRRSVHAKIGPYVDYWRGVFGRFVTLDAHIVSADPVFAAAVRAAGDPDRPSILSPDAMRKLLEAARDGKQAELLRSLKLTVQPGQRVSLQEFTRQSYVRDYDVQIAAAAGELDPVVDVLSTGPSVDVRVHLEPVGNGVTIEARLDNAEFEAMGERKLRLSKEYMTQAPLPAEPGKAPELVKGPVLTIPIERKVQLPVIRHDRIRTTLTVRDRESAVVASLFRNNRALLYILTPGIVVPGDAPAVDPAVAGERVMRLFDISALSRGVQDYAGPHLDLVSPSRGGGGPMTGATFTLDEPSIFMDSARVVQQIESRFAPGTWREHSIQESGGRLRITHKPEVLKEIDAFLNALITARARTIATEAVMVGFKKGARAEWEKEIPALAPGGYYADAAKVDKLLDEARRGKSVRVIAVAELTGLPQQRVHAFSGREESYIQDYEPQVSAYASAMDPIMGIFATGFVLDVRPAFVRGSDRISVDFRATYSAGELGEIDALGGGTGVIQTPKARVLKWAQNVVCEKGRYSVVASGRLGAGDEMEDVAVLLRCRPNLLK
jgi:hypothetical protein